MKIAVIENEYGAVSIDTALVEENVREVSEGTLPMRSLIKPPSSSGNSWHIYFPWRPDRHAMAEKIRRHNSPSPTSLGNQCIKRRIIDGFGMHSTRAVRITIESSSDPLSLV